MRYKRRHMTLLEVLIALSLMAILLTILMVFYRDQNQMNIHLDQMEQQAFRMMYVENRLSQILPQAISPYDSKKDFYFFTDSDANGSLKSGLPSLVFTYDNGNELDKRLSNHVLGRLYVDREDRLCLATMPSPQRWEHPIPLELEVLLLGVETLNFEFYVPPDRDRKIVLEQAKNTSASQAADTLIDIVPKNSWHSTWKSEYKQLPAMIRLTITLKTGQKMTYAFPFPNTDMVITYEQ